MKQFFSNLNLARWILLVAVLLSVVLAFTGWRLYQRRVFLDEALAVQVPRLAQEIQSNSLRVSRLWEQAKGAGLTEGQRDPQKYLQGLASHPKAAMGPVVLTESTTRSSVARDVEDKKYRIRPQDRDKGFRRANLANFMYLIEQRSRRMRVTNVRLTRAGKEQDWEYGNDEWTWELEVTSRQKMEDAQ